MAIDKFILASKLASDSILIRHAALECHGVAHAPWQLIEYQSAYYRAPWLFEGLKFRRVAPPRALERARCPDIETVITRQDEGIIRYTSRERTFADSLDQWRQSGGLEEVIRSLLGFAALDVDRLVHYLEILDKATLFAKVGYILERWAGHFGIGIASLQRLEHRRPTVRVYWRNRHDPGVLVRRWNLVVPLELHELAWDEGAQVGGASWSP